MFCKSMLIHVDPPMSRPILDLLGTLFLSELEVISNKGSRSKSNRDLNRNLYNVSFITVLYSKEGVIFYNLRFSKKSLSEAKIFG